MADLGQSMLSTRLGLMVGESHSYGKALMHNRPLQAEHWGMPANIYLIPAPVLGHNGMDEQQEHDKALKLSMKALAGKLQRNQVKLLLRGESGLARPSHQTWRACSRISIP